MLGGMGRCFVRVALAGTAVLGLAVAPGCFGASGCCARGSDSGPAPPADGGGPPPGACGDEIIDPGEECDGRNLAAQTCSTIGFAGGTLACTASCALDPAACHNCGNGQVDPDEACDGADLGGADCAALGFSGGALACAADCMLDAAGCSTCGNSLAEGGEACDGADLRALDCAALGYAAGPLACAADCTRDESACVPYDTYSLDFDGVDDRLDCGTAPALDALTDTLTIELWFYWDGDDGTLLAKWGEAFVDGMSFRVAVETSTSLGGATLFVYVANAPGSYSGTGYPVGPPGWHHLGYSFSPGCGYFVLDGADVPGPVGCTGGSTTVIAPSSAPLVVGGSPTVPGPSDLYYDGLIDEVRLWNVLRTDTEMIADMYTELTGTEPGLIAYLSFEDGPAPLTLDQSPTGLVCTLGTTDGADPADPIWSSDAPF
jgi:hypothetical protein